MRKLLASMRRWPAGRWFVYSGLAVGAFFVIQRAVGGASLYIAFMEGIGAAAAAMVLAGLGQRLYEGDKMKSAQLPGGAGAQFETAEAASKTRESVERLNERVTSQSERMITMQAQLDKRVSDLEDAAFKHRIPQRGPSRAE